MPNRPTASISFLSDSGVHVWISLVMPLRIQSMAVRFVCHAILVNSFFMALSMTVSHTPSFKETSSHLIGTPGVCASKSATIALTCLISSADQLDWLIVG